MGRKRRYSRKKSHGGPTIKKSKPVFKSSDVVICDNSDNVCLSDADTVRNETDYEHAVRTPECVPVELEEKGIVIITVSDSDSEQEVACIEEHRKDDFEKSEGTSKDCMSAEFPMNTHNAHNDSEQEVASVEEHRKNNFEKTEGTSKDYCMSAEFPMNTHNAHNDSEQEVASVEEHRKNNFEKTEGTSKDYCMSAEFPMNTHNAHNDSEQEVASVEEHRKNNFEKTEGTSKDYCMSAEFPMNTHNAHLCENQKSSTESGASRPYFEVVYVQERIKKEPFGNENNCADVNAGTPTGNCSVSQINNLAASSDAATMLSEVLIKNETDKCFVNVLHVGDVNERTDGSERKHTVEHQLMSNKSVEDRTPHIKVESTEMVSADTLVSTPNNLGGYVCYRSENSKMIESGSDIKYDFCSNILAAEHETISCSSQSSSNRNFEGNSIAVLTSDQILQGTNIKVEPSSHEENIDSWPSTGLAPSKTPDRDPKQARFCSITDEVKPSLKGLSGGILGSDSVCDSSCSKIASKNLYGKSCSTSPRSSGSPFDLSFNRNEQKAAEIIVSLPSEKLQVVIRQLAETRSMDLLKPILQERSDEGLPRPLSQNSETNSLHRSENKPVENDARNAFSQKREEENNMHSFCSLFQHTPQLIGANEIKQEITESLESNLTCPKYFHDSEASEKKLEVAHVNTEMLHSVLCSQNLGNDQRCRPSTAGTDTLSVSTEGKFHILHSLPDKSRMGRNGIASGTVSTVNPSLLLGVREGNSDKKIAESQQNELFLPSEKASDIADSNSALRSGEENPQNADNLALKQCTDQTPDRKPNIVLSDAESVVMSQPPDFHPGIAASQSSEIQVKKEPEDGPILHDSESACCCANVASSSVDFGKLLSSDILKGILDTASHFQKLTIASDTDDKETKYSIKNLVNSISCTSKCADDTVLTTSVKKEPECEENSCSENLQSLTIDFLRAVIETSKSSTLLNCLQGSSSAENGSNETADQSRVESLPPATESVLSSVKSDELSSKQPICHKINTEKLSEQDQSDVCMNVVKMARNLQSITENGTFGCGVEENSRSFETQDLTESVHTASDAREVHVSERGDSLYKEFLREKTAEAERDSFACGIEENTNSCGTEDLKVSARVSPRNYFSNHSTEVACSSSFSENDSCSETAGNNDGNKMRKRCKHFSAESNKRFKSDVLEVVTQDNPGKSDICVDDPCNSHTEFSGEEIEENMVIKTCSPLPSNKEENNSTTFRNVSESIKTKKTDSSLDKDSQKLENGSARSHTVSSEKVHACDSGAVDTSEGGDSLHKESKAEVGGEAASAKRTRQERVPCTDECNSYSAPLSAKGSNKVQRFASRSSLLTNEMLDGTSKLTHKQQKMPIEKKNDAATSFDCHLLVKTPPELNDLRMDEKRIEVLINRDQKKPISTSNKEDIKPVSNQAGVNSNRSAKLNMEEYKEKYKKHIRCTDSQKHVQFPVTAENSNQYQGTCGTKSKWNYSNSVSRNQHLQLEHERMPRSTRFLQFRGAPAAQFSYYSNNAVPIYSQSPQYFPPQARFSVPVRPHQIMPTPPFYPQALQRYAPPLMHTSYPAQYSFPPPQPMRPMCLPHIWTAAVNDSYHLQASMSPAQSVASPAASNTPETAAVPPQLPIDSSKDISSPQPLSAVKLSPKINTLPKPSSALKPVQIECVSSTVPKNSSGLPDCKDAEMLQRVHTTGEGLATSQLSLKSSVLEVNSPIEQCASTIDRSHGSRNTKSSSKPGIATSYDVSKSKSPPKDFLSSVLIWSVSWLSQQLQISDPPPIVNEIPKAESVYRSYGKYYDVHFAFLLLETWELIFQAWKREKRFHNYLCHLKRYEKLDKKVYEVYFETIVSASDFSVGKYPSEGYFIIIKFGLIPNGGTRVFGYVTDHSSHPFSSVTDSDHPCCKGHNINPVDNDHVLSLTVRTSWMGEDVDLNALTSVQVLHFLKPAVKQYDALLDLQFSPLRDAVLSPDISVCKLISLSKQKNSSVINEILNAIIQPEPPVVVVEALPGTDKVNTLVKVVRCVKALETVDEKTKILFCSRSGEVLDNVGCRVLYFQEGLEEKYKLRCVRLGKLTDVHPEIRNFSIHTFVEEYVEMVEQRELKDCERVIEEITRKISSTQANIMTLKKCSSVLATKLEKRLSELQTELTLKETEKDNVKSKHQKSLQVHQREGQWTLLNSSDIILTTFADCHQLEVANVSGKKIPVPRTCCIIDDASQCTEVEILPTLLNGVCKLVLVGDPNVAPRILSKLMEKSTCNLSYFRRARNQIRVK